MGNLKDKIITCTNIMYAMIFFGAIVNKLIRVNISIAILDMIKPANGTSSRFYQGNETRFEWNELQKNTLIGSFFWGYLVEVYGGYLSDRWGPKIVFGYGMTLAGLVTVLAPLFAVCHYYAILSSRVILGLISGSTLTCVMPLASKWIPKSKRSTFLSMMSGGSFGTFVALPIYGYIISMYGWASVFYASGAICMVFSVLWLYLIYDGPDSHPRISVKEKNNLKLVLIENKKFENRKPKSVPWRQLLTSKPMWAAVIAAAASVQAMFFMNSQLPNYMNAVHKLNIRSNGLYSSLPYIGHFFMTVIFSITADKMVGSGKYTILTVRKIFTTFSLLIPGIFLGVQTIYGDRKWTCVVLFCLILFFKSAVICGPMANILDIAPNYSGTIVGIDTTLGAIFTIILNEIVGIVTKTHNTFQQWRYILILLTVINLFSYLFYMIFASDQVQSWNAVEGQTDVKDEEKASAEPLAT